MKKFLLIFLLFSLVVTVLSGCGNGEETLTLNVYNWGEYISDGSDDLMDVNAQFEKETGIRINYKTYESNESMYTLLESGAAEYDVEEEVLDFFESVCGITEKDFELADLSFVPSYNVKELGFDKDLIASYGHDDKSCAFASLQAFFDSGDTDVTKIVIFASYEETGSAQTTGCQSEIINDVFLELTDNVKSYRGMIRSSSVISADVCAGYESKYSSHFEECASAVVGKGVGIIPYLGQKRGNDTEFRFRNEIKELAIKNNIPYQIETTKTTEGGGGTVSTFFATKGCRVIDIGVPVLGMHSPQEVISKKDLKAMYDLFKAFYEN